MRQTPAQRQSQADAGLASAKLFYRAELLAIYGALALIAAIVFWTISYHPF